MQTGTRGWGEGWPCPWGVTDLGHPVPATAFWDVILHHLSLQVHEAHLQGAGDVWRHPHLSLCGSQHLICQRVRLPAQRGLLPVPGVRNPKRQHLQVQYVSSLMGGGRVWPMMRGLSVSLIPGLCTLDNSICPEIMRAGR